VTSTSSTLQPDRERADIAEMYVVHRVFRREFQAAPGHVRRVPEGDRRRARVVADYLALILGGLHMHHTGEDAVLWPRLLERAAPSADLIGTMQAQHDRVDDYIEQIEPLAAAWTQTASALQGEQLAALLEDFAAALFEHLDLEEREILPLCWEHITPTEWNSLGQHGRDTMPLRQMPLLLGAILEDATAEERRRMLAPLPAPVRLVVRALGPLVYRRYVRRLRDA
jgi:hemerythrin-like domain-containing protein